MMIIMELNYNNTLENGFDYLQATIEVTLKEALTHDLRIIDVKVTEINQITSDTANVKFKVSSIYGDLLMEVNMNV